MADNSYDFEDAVLLSGSSTYFFDLPRYADQTKIRENCFCHGVDPKLQKVLKELGHIESEDLNEFNEIPKFVSGWEQSIFSKSAVEKI